MEPEVREVVEALEELFKGLGVLNEMMELQRRQVAAMERQADAMELIASNSRCCP